MVRQSLGVEPVDPAVMRRPPRRANDPILNRALGTRVLTNAALITAGTLYVYWKEMGHDGVVSRRDTTMTFTTFVMFDMFNAMACRHAEKPVIHLHPLSNIPLVIALGGSILGQLLVIYFPPLQVPPTRIMRTAGRWSMRHLRMTDCTSLTRRCRVVVVVMVHRVCSRPRR